ncbi:hypothetical protein GCM10027082_44200 [Comamonas humi]
MATTTDSCSSRCGVAQRGAAGSGADGMVGGSLRWFNAHKLKALSAEYTSAAAGFHHEARGHGNARHRIVEIRMHNVT